MERNDLILLVTKLNLTAMVNDKVMEKIFTYLGSQDLLAVRLVCKSFNLVVENRPSLLWNKFRLALAQKYPYNVTTTNFQSFLNMCRLNCRDYHFSEINLLATSNFIKDELIIFRLKLTYHSYSVSTLYEILTSCPELECLELVGVPLEWTCPTDKWPLFRKHSSVTMKSLKILILKASSHTIPNYPNPNRSIKPPSLSPGLLASLTNAAKSLESVQISGFDAWTCGNLVQILADHPHFANIKKLAFEDIIVEKRRHKHMMFGGRDFLSVLKRIGHIKLEMLVVTFNQDSYLEHSKKNLSRDMRETLQNYGDTLEDLKIVNCPVTEEIFQASMPNLKRLVLDVLPLKRRKMKAKIQQLFPNLYHLDVQKSYSIKMPKNKEMGTMTTNDFIHSRRQDSYIMYMQGSRRPSFKPPCRLRVYKLMLILVLALVGVQIISYLFPVGWRNQIVILGHVGIVFIHLLYKHWQWGNENDRKWKDKLANSFNHNWIT